MGLAMVMWEYDFGGAGQKAVRLGSVETWLAAEA